MPQPPIPELPKSEAIIAALRLDAALPARVVVGKSFVLAVAVRRPESPVLAPEDLERRESAEFFVEERPEENFHRLRLQVTAPECDIHGEDSKTVLLPAGSDSPTVDFHLTPRRAGSINISITVYQQTDLAGSARLHTEAGEEEPRGGLTMSFVSAPLPLDSLDQSVVLLDALEQGYDDSELQELAFRLGFDYEDLPGDTRLVKAISLVKKAQSHNRTDALKKLIKHDRPHLFIN
jgi:hypothetical protein